MRLPFKERVFLSVVIAGLAVVLVALAVLQYHWSQEVSAATSARLQANLDSSMLGWRDDFHRELTSVFAPLQVNPMLPLRDKAAQYTQQYQNWSQSSPHSNLVAHVFLLDAAGTEHARLLQLNIANNQLEPADWPADLAQVHALIDAHFAGITPGASRIHSLRSMHSGEGHHPGGMGGGMFLMVRPFGPDFIGIDVNSMTLVRAQFYHNGRDRPAINIILVQLDRKVLQEHIFPELAERYFSGSEARDYEVAVVAASGASLIYSSDSGFGKQGGPSPDGAMPIFGPPRGMAQRRGGPPFSPPPHAQGTGHRERNEMGFGGPFRIATIQSPDANNDWQLLVRHRRGSLEAVVAGMRRRDLAISFGVLLVLAAGIGIIVVSSQRARVLARLQMEFVATVSHELRTPLAVISSAAENIADGVVAGKQQLAQYGTEIKNQARQLILLVEQILLFAATRNKRHHYNLRPLRVVDVIETALKNTAGLIESAGVIVEQEVAPSLPPIVGDLPALSHCLQNLITNAVKYGGEARWMRIKAGVHEQGGQCDEVQISVEDKGLGIGAGDLRRIFEPFYRSRAAAAAQIHGTGLGLSLARDIANSMGGRLTVSSEPGKGSCFTVYLPFADVAQVQTSRQASPVHRPGDQPTGISV
jgi:signal transduction histidine kinase